MAELLPPIVNFLAVVSVFVIFGRKPFAALLASRSETIYKEMGEADKAFTEASQAFSQWEENDRDKEAHAKQELEDTKSVLTRHKEKTLSAAKNEAERIQREAKMMGTNEVTQAKESLQRELAEKSIQLAEEFLGKQLERKEKEKLVSEYVELVGSGAS